MGGRGWCSVGFVLLLSVSPGCRKPPESRPAAQTPQVAVPVAPVVPVEPKPIYFLKGDATLSPGALDKLKSWVQTWGPRGTWLLTVPEGPGLTYGLLEKRVLALRAELRRLGVARIDTRLGPREPAGTYDVIHVSRAAE